MNDYEELEDLYRKRSYLDAGIMGKKVEIAKKEGKVVDSVDELVCKIHSGSKFKESGEIKGSVKFAGNSVDGKLKTYICEECDKEKYEHIPTDAHECNNCGIVYGNPLEHPYNEVMPMAGSKGVDYLCKVCGSKIGRYAWMFS